MNSKFYLFFVAVFPALAAGLYFFVFKNSPQMATVYVACKVLQFCLPFANFSQIAAYFKSRAGPSRLHLAWGFATGIFLAAVLLALYYGFLKDSLADGETPRSIRHRLQQLHSNSFWSFLFLASFFSFVHSFLEEFYWRFSLHREIKKTFTSNQSIVLSSVAFSLHHAFVIAAYAPRQWGLIFAGSLAVILAGACWAKLFERFSSLWPGWISHMLTDIALMFVGYELTIGSGGN